MKFSLAVFAALLSTASAHYTFPSLVVGGQVTPEWVNVRMTNNHYSNGPVTDVKSADFRCYTSETRATASTISVAAGSTIGFAIANGGVSHPGAWNTYMAKVPSGQTAASWDGSGAVWFKVHEIPAVANGQTITFPSQGLSQVTFTLPKSLPSGDYLIRGEHIALHSASSVGGAQFYIACGQINVTGGGSGSPGPLVSIPGVYTGQEPGILINIYYPIPSSYKSPGPAVWRG